MKFDLEDALVGNTFRAYTTGMVQVNNERVTQSLIVTPESLWQNWAPVTVAELEAGHFEAVLDYHPEILLLGTGATQCFPHMRLLAELAAQGMGIEVMDTPSACRTYNILLADQRRVAAALFMIQPSKASTE